MRSRPAADELARAAILADPVRRALYLYVTRQAGDVGRDQAARAARVERALAAFHLDKLVEAGLLDVSYRRLTGRSGPGAGRPSKLYRRSAREIEIQVPPRRYRLLAELLATAIDASGGRAGARALARAARTLGEKLGGEARAEARSSSRDALLVSAERVLDEAGFQPYRAAPGEIRLRNCPFDALARDHRDLVCRSNVELVEGIIEGLRMKGVEASFEPTAGECCVALRRRGEALASGGRGAPR